MAEGTTTVAVNDPMDIDTAAAKVVEGRNLIDESPEKAVELLYAAVRAYEKHYGGDAVECAPVYMYYGIALFEVARNSTDALGTAKTTVKPIPGQKPGAGALGSAGEAAACEASGTGKEGKEKPVSEETKALGDVVSEPAPEVKKSDADQPNDETDTDTGNTTEKEDDRALAAGEEGEDTALEGGDAEEEGGDGGEDDGDGEAEAEADPSSDDMKLAWEMLEMARVIYSKQPNPEEHHDKLAEVHRALGEIKAEQDNFEEAVEGFKQSLRHLESMEPRDNRRMAEAQFMLSVLLTYLDQPEEALQMAQTALSLMEAAVSETEEKLAALPTDGSGGEAAEDEGRRLQKVSDDLQEAILELQGNIEGLQEAMAKAVAGTNLLKEAIREAFGKAPGEIDKEALAAVFASATARDAFSAPFNRPAAVQAVSLGVVGRGSKRITLQHTSAAAKTQPKEAPADVQQDGLTATGAPKRTLEDVMGAAPVAGIDNAVGFGAVAVVETREEGGEQQVAKKPRTEEPAQEGAVVAADS